MLDAPQPPRPTTPPLNTTPRIEIPADVFQKLADLIYEISGIRFQESKTYFLSSKLGARCAELGMTTIQEYYDYIASPSGKIKEHVNLMNAVTVNETFFFRNQPQLEAFETNILKPLILKRKQEGKQKIRIWSCAASTGDEAYTTALQLLGMAGSSHQIEFEIVGTDICQEALEKARQGVYKPYAVRNIPPALMQRYFVKDEAKNEFTLSNDVKQRVKFRHCNLMDRSLIRGLGTFDIAFCRNVLIYFDDKSKEVALNNISDSLAEDGFLLVGHSENIYSQRHIFKADPNQSASIAYVKAPPGTPKL